MTLRQIIEDLEGVKNLTDNHQAQMTKSRQKSHERCNGLKKLSPVADLYSKASLENQLNGLIIVNNFTGVDNEKPPLNFKNLEIPMNPSIQIDESAVIERDCVKTPLFVDCEGNELKTPTHSPGPILPLSMLPNVFVRPLIEKWMTVNGLKSPGLQCTSSEESTSSEPIHGDFFAGDLREEYRNSLYKTTLHLLANDIDYQKEVVLGKRIGFYRLGKEIGSGNFSKVKLGVHVLTKEKVAIKLMEKSKMDQKAQRLLMREIDNMELMHHPNIIRLFECVETLSKVYLIMEYAGGGELYTYVHQNGKLSEDVSRPIFAQLVSAVTHLHTKGISHRDIKPENVIFSQPGWVKLADFGFSCKYQFGSLLNTFCGSPPYAAPELFRDESYDGFKVDIWALGVVLYFMLVGVTPFRGESMQDLKRNILSGSYSVPEYVSTFAQHLIARMIEMNISKRSTILELRRTYWLKDNKFPDSYLQLSLNPDEEQLETNEVERQVWTILKNYGINEAMIREASDKGSRNSIIGTYRIVLYQCQAKDRDEERMRCKNHLILLSERNRQLAVQMKQQSKACNIL